MMHKESPEPQRRLTISTISSDWVEGTGTGYQVQKGSVSFNWSAQDVNPWAFPGSDITAVINGAGNSRWRFADSTTPDKDGWQTVAVDPGVVAARVAGISHGFVFFDDVGSEYERDGDKFTFKLFPNRMISSKDGPKQNAPYMTVETGEADNEAPEAIGPITSECEGLPPGEARISWQTPADRGPAGVIGFLATLTTLTTLTEAKLPDPASARPIPHYLVPLAAEPGGRVVMHLRDMDLKSGATVTIAIRPVDAAGNIGPATTATITVSALPAAIELKPATVKPFDPAGDRPTIGGVQVAVIDALDKVQPLTGAMVPARDPAWLTGNHLWSAAKKTVRLHAARNEFVDFQILLSGVVPEASLKLTFDDQGEAAPTGQLYRFRHVNTRSGPMPDPLVPLNGPLSIPATDEKLADQKHATVLAEVYVPHTAKPGQHTGSLTITVGQETLVIKIELNVWDFVLPDQLSFIPEMNCYGLPEADLPYYRLAQVHRTCLNRLGYNWRGQVNDGCGPRWTGADYQWADYDRHYGPILDGSAFKDLPRGPVPVESFYLPLNESWPLDVNKAFKGGYWIEDAFGPEYRQGFVEACRKYVAHLKDKGWNQTLFEFYLNGKVSNKGKSWDRCSSPWTFDEPANTQDFWALRWYGMAFHEGAAAAGGDVRAAFRCDISRPQWQRDMLDGVLDVNIIGGEMRRYQRMIVERKARTGEIAFNYGSSNKIEESNVQPAAWCLEGWCLGVDGVLPWQTMGNNRSWTDGDQLALFYPGGPAGLKEPIASIRLKSYRRGQQDVEYLTILTQTIGAPRFAVSAAVRDALKLSGQLKTTSADDAGTTGYGKLDPAALWQLRMQVGAMLNETKPPPKKQWVTLRPPPRDVTKLPHIGSID